MPFSLTFPYSNFSGISREVNVHIFEGLPDSTKEIIKDGFNTLSLSWSIS